MDKSADFVIITALEEEREAVLRKLPRKQKLKPSNQDIHVYYSARITTPTTQDSYRVIVMSLVGMGRVQAATATADAIRRWRPTYVFLVGIAGGVAASGVKLGDILVSDQIVDYELQKITTEKIQVRWEVHRATPRLITAARNLDNTAWQKLVTIPRPTKGVSRRHIGPVASGDKVVAASEIIDKHRETWPKLIGIEMEAGGTATAVSQAATPPGFFMIRGVSDLADEAKGSPKVEQWRFYACDVAAAYAIALIQSNSTPSKSAKSKSGRAKNAPPQPRKNVSVLQATRLGSQLEKDQFILQSYKHIMQNFQRLLSQLKLKNKDCETIFEQVDSHKFVCKLYIHGELENQCKIWIGDIGNSDAILYAAGKWINVDRDNTYNGWFYPVDSNSKLYLRLSFWSVQASQQELELTKEKAAEFLWKYFVSPD